MADHFDRTGRRLAKEGGTEFIGWLLRLQPEQYRFLGWLDTRHARPPNEPEGAGDTVARLRRTTKVEPDWLFVIEFQTEPDIDMFGRMLVYMGTKVQEEKPNDLPADRYLPGGAVVNLTGKGSTSRRAEWNEAGTLTELGVRERDLEREDADKELAGMEAGNIPKAGLPFVVLMQGGDLPSIIERWKMLASAEPDAKRRALWASTALILSDAGGRWDVWKEALKEFDVKTSRQVLEWQAEARAEGVAQGVAQGQAAAVTRILAVRFGAVPMDLTAALVSTDPERLSTLLEVAVTAPSLADFRQAAGL